MKKKANKFYRKFFELDNVKGRLGSNDYLMIECMTQFVKYLEETDNIKTLNKKHLT